MKQVNLYPQSSRSYYDVYNAFIMAYPRKPTWIFKEISGMFDHNSAMLNRIATDILYPVTRESAYSFADLCDYYPTEISGATDELTITLNEAMEKTLPKGYKFGGFSDSTGNIIPFETTEVGRSNGTDKIVVAAKQKVSYSNEQIGNIEGSEAFSDYPIEGFENITRENMSLIVGTDPWLLVKNFDASKPDEKHFVLIYQSSGRCRIGFGDGTTGAKPISGEPMYLSFETSSGLLGKMDPNTIDINSGDDSDIKSVVNAGSSGGNNAESVSAIIRNARANVRLRDIIWTKEDLEIAARSSSSSVQKALGLPGLGKATIDIVPSGGGEASPALCSEVAAYVQARTQFGALPIIVRSATLVPVDIGFTITVRNGYSAEKVKNLTEFSMTLVSSCFDSQVLEHFEDFGIESTRTELINVLWTWDFDEEDNQALKYIIESWSSLLGDREYREWGQALEVGDLWISGNGLYDFGLDIFNLTTPITNVSPGEKKIISTGVVEGAIA